jgi:putative phosphoesterase
LGDIVKIAILSDTHSRHATVARALQLLEGRGVELIIHCGDIEDADTVWHFPAHTHFVFGNCDADRMGLRRAIEELGATLHDPFGELALAGARLAFLHGDDSRLLRELKQSGKYDYLFHGHTHVAADHTDGRTRVINPGALHRARPKTFAILDLPGGELESVIVE